MTRKRCAPPHTRCLGDPSSPWDRPPEDGGRLGVFSTSQPRPRVLSRDFQTWTVDALP